MKNWRHADKACSLVISTVSVVLFWLSAIVLWDICPTESWVECMWMVFPSYFHYWLLEQRYRSGWTVFLFKDTNYWASHPWVHDIFLWVNGERGPMHLKTVWVCVCWHCSWWHTQKKIFRSYFWKEFKIWIIWGSQIHRWL